MKPGMKYELFTWGDDAIQIVPVRSIKELRGAYPNIDTTIEREPDREL